MVKPLDPNRTFAVLYLDGVPARLIKLEKASEDFDVRGAASCEHEQALLDNPHKDWVPSLSKVKLEGWALYGQSATSIQEHIDKHTEKPQCSTTK